MKLLYTSLIILFSFSLQAQVVNDNCADAIPISEVMQDSFSNIGATTDGPLHIDSPCPGNADPLLDSLYNDIWYLYTASFTGVAQFSLCGTADFDTKIAVYNPGSACPPQDGDLLACNEDGPNCSLSTSELIFLVSEGESYLLRIAGYGDASPGLEGSGTFSVSEFTPAVPNDFCFSATTVVLGETQEFSSFDATTDGPLHDDSNPCFQFGDNTIQSDIWFKFTPDFTGPVLWATCDAVTFDSRLGVYGPDIACEDLDDSSLYACNDDGAGCPNYSSALFFDVVEGSTYLLRLGGYNGENGLGTFDLINQTPPEPPVNNMCADAIPLAIEGDTDNAVVGTTIAGSADLNTFQFPSCIGNTNGGEFSEVWYSFNNNGYQEITLDFFSLTSDASFYVDVWEDCSTPTDTLVVLSNCSSLLSGEDVFISDTLGLLANSPTDYLLRITTRLTSDTPGDFELVLQALNPLSTFEVPNALAGEVSLSPNPVQGSLNLEIPLNRKSVLSYSVQNMLGQTLLSNKIGHVPSGIHYQNINVNTLIPGIYIIHLVVDEEPIGIKFIKQ